MTKYHISKNGKLNKCTAKIFCRLGGSHFPSEDEGIQYLDSLNLKLESVLNGNGYSNEIPFNDGRFVPIDKNLSEEDVIIEKIKRLKSVTTTGEQLGKNIYTPSGKLYKILTKTPEEDRDLIKIRDLHIENLENELKGKFPSKFSEYKKNSQDLRVEKEKKVILNPYMSSVKKGDVYGYEIEKGKDEKIKELRY